MNRSKTRRRTFSLGIEILYLDRNIRLLTMRMAHWLSIRVFTKRTHDQKWLESIV